jgi:hypothetical protein
MKFAKSFLMGTGAVVLAGLVLTLVAPKAAHAIAATAVQVENTRSSPVPNQDVDIPARHVFTATCSSTGLASCELFPFSVPANNEFVIQNVSMSYYSGGSTGLPASAFLDVVQGGQADGISFPILQQMNQSASSQNLAVNQQVTLYADPGINDNVCGMVSGTAFSSGASFSCTVTGYLVSLP